MHYPISPSEVEGKQRHRAGFRVNSSAMSGSNNKPPNKSPSKGRVYVPRTATHTVVDLLSRREHSEKELKQKLKKREFTNEEIDQALQKAKDHQLISKPEDIAERFANQLHRKNKGIHFINSTLHEKGLPSVSRDEELELEKAKALVKTKYSRFNFDSKEATREEKLKVMRFLASRGFDSSTIRKVINDEEF
jgi:regulatory protein